MRSAVTHGHLVRHTEPRAQFTEVLERFDLRSSLRPFTRCMVCNGSIVPVEKTDVLELLPSLTAANYDEFWRCTGCGRVYWKGSHARALEGRIAEATGGVKSSG